MNTPKKSDPTYSNLLQADPEPAKEGPSRFDTIAKALAGAGEVASGLAADVIHQTGQDFVSRVLLGEAYSRPKEAEPEHDKEDRGLDR
jgi:hypothetical protein